MALSPGSTLVDYVVPTSESRNANLVRDGLLVVGFSIFMAFCAQVSFYTPFSPVPITLQTLATLLIGAALGSRRGAIAVLLYLAGGALGLPIFAGSISGIARFTGVTAGYLVAFPIAAFVTGWLCERRFLDRRFLTSAFAMLPGTLLIYVFGATWLAIFLHVDPPTAFAQGVLPFIPGDLFKLIIAAALLPTAWMIVRRVRPHNL